MKVLWLCNLLLPIFENEFNQYAPPYGGWIAGLLDDIRRCEDIEITVCFAANEDKNGAVNGINYIGYREKEDNIAFFKEILIHINPDLIHIWGTENKRSFEMMKAAYDCHMKDNTVINIQGLVSVYSKYHFDSGISKKIINSHRPVEIKYGHSLKNDKEDMIARGKYEIEALKMAKNVIGRTDWDEACVKQINPYVNYYTCNPTLRSAFYHNIWNYDKCEKHSIFASQANYPIKGFHHLINALPEILKKYPDAKLYTTGESPLTAYSNTHGRIRQRSYPRYLAQLIVNNHLEDKVVFLGLLDEEKMCERFKESHVFASPSSIENESNSVGEAMLLGMPVVSSYVGGVYNFMENKKEGYFYQYDAPYMLPYYICKVFDANESVNEMCINARIHALKSFDKNENLQKMLSIYDAVIS